jgi:SPP1 gp7 family putative phage head morphogenesis protein
MIIRGEAPDRAITAISKQFDVSRAKAGRLVMTESAAFSSAGQKDCFEDLGVEQYQIIASLDRDTCDICGAMDLKVFKMSEYQVGLTANPFHPWCRCCTAPYFEDMAGVGQRYARDAVTGESFTVPKGMTYEQWKAQQDELYGAGTVAFQRKISYNTAADKEQFEAYKERLGRANVPRSFAKFQSMKYQDTEQYDDLVGFYRYIGKNPTSSKAYYEANKAVSTLRETGQIKAKGTVVSAPVGHIVETVNAHAAERMAERSLTQEWAQSIVDHADFALKQRKGTQYVFYNKDGFVALGTDGCMTSLGQLDAGGQKMYDEVMKYAGTKK